MAIIGEGKARKNLNRELQPREATKKPRWCNRDSACHSSRANSFEFTVADNSIWTALSKIGFDCRTLGP